MRGSTSCALAGWPIIGRQPFLALRQSSDESTTKAQVIEFLRAVNRKTGRNSCNGGSSCAIRFNGSLSAFPGLPQRPAKPAPSFGHTNDTIAKSIEDVELSQF